MTDSRVTVMDSRETNNDRLKKQTVTDSRETNNNRLKGDKQ